jgi:acetyl-CoA acetyltransferase
VVLIHVAARATILGVGEADGGKATGRRGVELAAEAALRAVEDARMTFDQLDGLLVEDPDRDQHHMAHLALCDMLGWQPRFAASTACGGATPFANAQLAIAAIHSGLAECILVVDADARQTTRSPELSNRLTRTGGHRDPWEEPYGPITMSKFALVERAHMAQFGTTREQLAHITVNARANALQREGAQLRKAISIEEVLASPPIAEPIHLLDCSLVSDWGSAFVLTGTQQERRGVNVIGFGQGHEGYALSQAESLCDFPGIAASGRRAFGMAGVSPSDVDVALVYDSFTISVVVALENLGFCAIGEGGSFVASGAITPSGTLPINPHGGQLAYSGGHGHFVVEAVRQLRREAPTGQVNNARIALCQGTAAGVLSSYTLILGQQ